MICPNCKTRNPIGNKFCRQCGAPLVLPEGSLAAEEAARVEAERQTEKVAELMAQSHVLADARKFDEAIPLAEEAAQISPKSTSAHSLLATLYERTEQEQKAIAAMETVVRLNPGSVADQIKLDQLKRGIHVLPRSVPVGSSPRMQESTQLPWMPLALSGGVMVVVLGAGLWWLNRSQAARKQTPQIISQPVAAPTAPPVSAANPSGIAPVYVAPSPGATPIPRFSSATVPGPPPPASQVRDDPFASRGLGPRPQTTRATPSAPVRRTAPPTNPTVPRPITPVAPVTIVPPPGVGVGNTSPNGLPPISAGPPQGSGGTEIGTGDTSSTGGGQPASSGFGAGGRIPVGPPPQTTPGNGSPTNPDSASSRTGGTGDSYIHISVGRSNSSGGAKRSAGGTGGSSASAFTPSSPLARARALQQSGQYRQAIGAYREAASGSSAGSAYQGMAQCYESLNETGGAKSAYRDAIRAYTAQGSASAQRGINSCKAALEVLGGG